MSRQPEREWTWARAIIVASLITAALLVTLGFLPSIIRYTWDNNTDAMIGFIADKTGFEFKDTYTMVRIHDAIAMGLQTFIFAIPIAATYILGERRRRRLGLRGSDAVKGYLPGK
ncbi:MAG: hypothetical protein WD627_13255 [Actinomycetota bacterium]